MRRIRGGSGLGDSVYVRVVAEHLAKTSRVVAMSDYPDVFIGSGAAVEPFTRTRIDVLAHYSARKALPLTTQWDDVCDTAGVGRIPLRFDWAVRNRAPVDGLRARAGDKPIVLVHGGRAPMGRGDGFGSELLPRREAFETVLGAFADCYTVRIGNAPQIYPLHVDVDLNGGTSVSDLLDLFCFCDAVIAQCSFAVPLAECFRKPLLTVWAARGLASGKPFIRQITPRKVIGPEARYVVDDWSIEQIMRAARGMRDEFMAVAA